MSKALRHFPQLVIADLFLPDTSGDFLVRKMKYKIPSMKVPAYTFSYSSESIIKIPESGVDGYVIKKEDTPDRG